MRFAWAGRAKSDKIGKMLAVVLLSVSGGSVERRIGSTSIGTSSRSFLKSLHKGEKEKTAESEIRPQARSQRAINPQIHKLIPDQSQIFISEPCLKWFYQCCHLEYCVI
jgi:hypothetical protein